MADSDNKKTNEDGGDAPETEETVEEQSDREVEAEESTDEASPEEDVEATAEDSDREDAEPEDVQEDAASASAEDEPEEAADGSDGSDASDASDASETADANAAAGSTGSTAAGGDGDDGNGDDSPLHVEHDDKGSVVGVAAFFDHPDNLMSAARHARDSDYERFDAYSPFPIHGMDDAMGLGRSWIPWVTFFAGLTGFILANAMQFGMMTFDWPMIVGGKPYAPWPSFVPIMFELTVLLGGVTTGIVALAAGGCFRKPFIIDPDITNDRFALWISADDASWDQEEVIEFMESLRPVEIRTVTESS